MASDPLSAGLGAVSLLTGMDANRGAELEARGAKESRDALIARATRVYDKLFGMAQEADRQGRFDPERSIAALNADTSRYEAADAGNTAGAMRVAGYRPGDSEIGKALGDIKLKYRDSLNDLSRQARQSALTSKMGAYSAASSALGALNGGIGAAQSDMASALGRVQNPAGFMSSWLGSFDLGGKRAAKSAGDSSPYGFIDPYGSSQGASGYYGY